MLVNTDLRAGLNMTCMCSASTLPHALLFPSKSPSTTSVQFLGFHKIQFHFYLIFLPVGICESVRQLIVSPHLPDEKTESQRDKRT